MIHEITSKQRKTQLEKNRELDQNKKEIEIANLQLKLQVDKENKETQKKEKIERKYNIYLFYLIVIMK